MHTWDRGFLTSGHHTHQCVAFHKPKGLQVPLYQLPHTEDAPASCGLWPARLTYAHYVPVLRVETDAADGGVGAWSDGAARGDHLGPGGIRWSIDTFPFSQKK